MTEASKPRFVLLRHEVPESYGRASHWDLMVERPGITQEHRLATWAFEDLPKAWAQLLPLKNSSTEPIEAIQLPDHRAYYLDYEGPVSDGRGVVTRSLVGTATWREMSSEHCEIELQAVQPTPFGGVLTLVAKSTNGPSSWFLEWVGNPS